MKQYQKIFQEMLSQNESLFARFKKIHDRYVVDPNTHKKEFNLAGEEVFTVIRKYENQLVRSTENSNYSKFSINLSDKFWSGIRALFPKIDFVGVK